MTTAASETVLIQAARNGDRAAFDTLVTAASPKVRGILLRMVGHPEDVEDLLQDALIKAWRSLVQFRGEALFSTWLASIATRLAIDHLRANTRWRKEAQVAYANRCAESETLSGEVMAAFAAPDFAFEVRQHIGYCFACVGRSLPPDEQAALVLRDVLDLSTREAANILNTSESVLRHRLAAARGAMTERFEGLCALVNKEGICHQCKGLSEVAAMTGAAVGPPPEIADLAERLAIVRGSDPEGGCTQALHQVFWRRTKEAEDQGLGSTEPLSDCGQD